MLTIVEKQAMVQAVVASAAMFQSGLKASGHTDNVASLDLKKNRRVELVTQ